jgi:hypothetical protein
MMRSACCGAEVKRVAWSPFEVVNGKEQHRYGYQCTKCHLSCDMVDCNQDLPSVGGQSTEERDHGSQEDQEEDHQGRQSE